MRSTNTAQKLLLSFSIAGSTLLLPSQAAATTVDNVYVFKSGMASNPELVSDSEGNLYGTTETGGTFNKGILFEIKGGKLITLHNFGGTIPNGNKTTLKDGANPIEGLVKDKNGNFYGITNTGGSNNTGAAFKITNGAYNIIYNNPYQQTYIGGLTINKSTSNPIIISGSAVRASQMLALQKVNGIWGSTVIMQYPKGGATFGHPTTKATGDIFYIKNRPDGLQEVVDLKPSGTNTWTPISLHTFTGPNSDLTNKSESLVLGNQGQIYGIASGPDVIVWQLSPVVKNSSKYKLTTLFTYPQGAAGAAYLTSDEAGGFYNETFFNHGYSGEVQHLQSPSPTNKSWTLDTIYNPNQSGYYVNPSLISNGKLFITAPTRILSTASTMPAANPR